MDGRTGFWKLLSRRSPQLWAGVPDGATLVERNWTILSNPRMDSRASLWEFLRDKTETNYGLINTGKEKEIQGDYRWFPKP